MNWNLVWWNFTLNYERSKQIFLFIKPPLTGKLPFYESTQSMKTEDSEARRENALREKLCADVFFFLSRSPSLFNC